MGAVVARGDQGGELAVSDGPEDEGVAQGHDGDGAELEELGGRRLELGHAPRGDGLGEEGLGQGDAVRGELEEHRRGHGERGGGKEVWGADADDGAGVAEEYRDEEECVHGADGDSTPDDRLGNRAEGPVVSGPGGSQGTSTRALREAREAH